MAKNFSSDVADKLLDKLSSDDSFRDLFQRNPRAALRQLGHETPKDLEGIRGSDPVMCFSASATLASKEQIRATRDTLRAQLTSNAFHYEMAI